MVNGNNRIVFFGTPEICIPFLDKLKGEFETALIITQPDSFGGRSKTRIEPPVKRYADNNNLYFIQPEIFGINEEKIIRDINPVIGTVISYGKFLPKNIYSIPDFNMINVHFSLLPEYRGAAPVQRAIEADETFSGFSIFEIERRMDAGPVWHAEKIKIIQGEMAGSLISRIAEAASSRLPGVIKDIIHGKIKKTIQKKDAATFAPAIKKSEGRIFWNNRSEKIFNRFRAFHPWPGIFFFSGDKKIAAKEVSPVNGSTKLKPGALVELNKDRLIVACGDETMLGISKIQPEGKKVMPPFIYSLGNKIADVLN